MNAVLWIFVALSLGLMLFLSLQEDIPEEVGFLKVKPALEQLPRYQKQKFDYKGWSVNQADYTVEMTKRMDGELKLNGSSFEGPVIGVLCHEGALDMRIDARYALTGTTALTVKINGKPQAWTRGADTNVFPKAPKALLKVLTESKDPVSFALSYVDFGEQTFTVDVAGLKEMAPQLPPSCR